ncbi:hypothetical protein [Spiroplasma endosymbiont of Polydrusus pterygomalis]|uniref:hypothetical protein n=1 Tax=Spiroplasma endosymbiont of Polydrusus pterygomalis TaxID=3139327 RepID=UPI003CCAA856
MKKLIDLFAIATIVETSASSLKPLFTDNVASHGFKLNKLKASTNPFFNQVNGLAGPNTFASNRTLWAVKNRSWKWYL